MQFNYWQNIEAGNIYHIYNKAISNLKLFRDDSDYLFFLSKYNKYFYNYFDTYAYCLIPNHFHLLIKMKSEDEIRKFIEEEKSKAAMKYLNKEIPINLFVSDQFRRFFSSIAIKYNNKYHHEGSIFINKMKRVRVSTDGSIQRLLCYIHHNPIHHGLTQDYNQWNYSSYNHYNSHLETNIVNQTILEWLGGQEVFNEIHRLFKNDSLKLAKEKFLFG